MTDKCGSRLVLLLSTGNPKGLGLQLECQLAPFHDARHAQDGNEWVAVDVIRSRPPAHDALEGLMDIAADEAQPLTKRLTAVLKMDRQYGQDQPRSSAQLANALNVGVSDIETALEVLQVRGIISPVRPENELYRPGM